jgi:hypothetical protein
MPTFFGAWSSPWKWGARTCFATASSPFAFALSVAVIGVKRLMYRQFCSFTPFAVSRHILSMKSTGSTGWRVRKKITALYQLDDTAKGGVCPQH